jgi:hypothetical protein
MDFSIPLQYYRKNSKYDVVVIFTLTPPQVARMIDEQTPTLENPVQFKVVHKGGALVREG